jgi:hypothetical protein
VLEREREELIGSTRRIVAALAVDDIKEVAPGFVPEPLVESDAR